MRIAQKTASYAVMHLTVAFAVVYALTGDWRPALAVGLVEPFFQTIAFAIHERVWAKIQARPAKAQRAADEAAHEPHGWAPRTSLGGR